MAFHALVSSGSARGSPWTQTLARGRRSKRASHKRCQTTVTARFGGRASNPGEEGQAVGTKWTPFGAGSLANPTRTAKATFADSVTVPLPPDEMIANRRRRVANRKNAGSPTSKVPPVRLLTSYDQTVATIVEEINRTASGDRVEFSVYVLEPGESTERVLDAMRRAARRGVRVDASLDCSAVSSFTRWCEGTATLASELVEMEKRFPDTVTFTPRKIPTHAKYVMCHRASSVSTAVFGGVNIGDRFKPWRDFAIRAEGSAAVGALSLGVNGSLQTIDSKDTQGSTPKIDTRIGNPYFLRKKPRTVASAVSGAKDMLRRGVSLTVGSRHRNAGADAEARRGGVGFFTNRPNGWSVLAWAFPRFARFPGRFDVYPALIDLMDDTRWDRYTVAAAYVDRCGVDVLTPALVRGAKMTLVMPRNPNVYHDANRKALKRLMDMYGGENGQVRAYMCDDMLHAKVFLAESSTTGESAAMIGSCNLKQRSFGQFAELNALIVQPSCTRQLEKELAKLVSESELVVESDMRFSEPKATIEEWLG